MILQIFGRMAFQSLNNSIWNSIRLQNQALNLLQKLYKNGYCKSEFYIQLKCCILLFHLHSIHWQLPQSDVEAMDVLAMDEQLSFKVISMRPEKKSKFLCQFRNSFRIFRKKKSFHYFTLPWYMVVHNRITLAQDQQTTTTNLKKKKFLSDKTNQHKQCKT